MIFLVFHCKNYGALTGTLFFWVIYKKFLKKYKKKSKNLSIID